MKTKKAAPDDCATPGNGIAAPVALVCGLEYVQEGKVD
jgi:hypothetical protein